MGEIESGLSLPLTIYLWSNTSTVKTTLAPSAVVAFLVLVTLHSFATGQAEPVLVGVLEDDPGHVASEPHYRAVRAVFYREGEQWSAFPSDCSTQDCLRAIAKKYPGQVRWTIAFNGRHLGTVESRTPEAFDSYSSVGQQVISGASVAPTVGQPSQEFGGFLGEAVYRPLIAVSRPNYLDPDGWKTAIPPAVVTLGIRQQFRKQFPHVTNCTKGHSENAGAWPYQDANIIIQKAYASKRGWIIAEARLSPYLCDGPPEEAFASHWFVITPQRQIRFLDSHMWLVDSGDYDGDGKSELVFSIKDYNRGGYKLFYDDFRRRAVFEFNYH